MFGGSRARLGGEKIAFTAAKTGGVKNYFVELEEDPSLMPLSVPYLKSLNV